MDIFWRVYMSVSDTVSVYMRVYLFSVRVYIFLCVSSVCLGLVYFVYGCCFVCHVC